MGALPWSGCLLVSLIQSVWEGCARHRRPVWASHFFAGPCHCQALLVASLVSVSWLFACYSLRQESRDRHPGRRVYLHGEVSVRGSARGAPSEDPERLQQVQGVQRRQGAAGHADLRDGEREGGRGRGLPARTRLPFTQRGGVEVEAGLR